MRCIPVSENRAIDVLWDDNPVDITAEANFIWSIANKLRGSYMPDKYGDVIIPMTIIRRFECALEQTRKAVADMFEKNPAYTAYFGGSQLMIIWTKSPSARPVTQVSNESQQYIFRRHSRIVTEK